ncbi:MAG: PepSY domain-containing protein [Cellvibrionaceae bacterium]|nr:PepSY domain-containing protein [Cellvibrionaceae bacterium]
MLVSSAVRRVKLISSYLTQRLALGKPGIRVRGTALHNYVGLWFGYLCLLIFLTGTLSFYRQELLFWSQAELHQSSVDPVNVKGVVLHLEQNAAHVKRWDIQLPSERNPNVRVRWREPVKDGQRRGDRVTQYLSRDAIVLPMPRESRFVDVIYRAHFELYGIGRTYGRLIIGLATLAMLVAIVSGVIIHRRIFVDFFTFRKDKALRSWLDAHNVSAVVSLPFHILICFSGLLLIMYLLMPWAADRAFDGDFKALNADGGGKRSVKLRQDENLPIVHTNWEQGAAAGIGHIYQQVDEIWPAGIRSIRIELKKDGSREIIFSQNSAESLLNRGNSKRWHFRTNNEGLIFQEQSVIPDSFARLLYNFTTAFHLQRHADSWHRAFFFLSGILGRFMIASGLNIWVKRHYGKQKKDRPKGRAQRLIEALNILLFVGLPIAIVVAMFVNRIVPASITFRSTIEIYSMFSTLALSFIHALFPNYISALRHQLWVLALLCLLLSSFNILVFYPWVLDTDFNWWAVATAVKVIDVLMLLMAVLLILFLKKPKAKDRKSKNKKAKPPRYETASSAVAESL